VPVWTAQDTPWLVEFQRLLARHKEAAGAFPAGDGAWQPLLEHTGLFDALTHAQATHISV
jgi:hypothetical protein